MGNSASFLSPMFFWGYFSYQCKGSSIPMSIVIWDGFCSCSSDVGVRVSKFRLVVSLPFWVWRVVLELFFTGGVP